MLHLTRNETFHCCVFMNISAGTYDIQDGDIAGVLWADAERWRAGW